MDYSLEELLPVVAKLSESYTSFESSSVPYETAQMLLGAVMYCVEKCMGQGERIAADKMIDAEEAYQRGYDLITEKVYQAKGIYESLIQDFEDYGCWNYKDTILKGMPEFFLWYDPKYQPQNHILTLDYPVISITRNQCGIDLIYEYLSNISTEKHLLDCFETYEIRRMLERIVPEYEELYMDNICEAVLFNAVKCFLADRPVRSLECTKEDQKVIADVIKSNGIESEARKMENIIRIVVRNIFGQDVDQKTEQYFTSLGKNFAVRMLNTI